MSSRSYPSGAARKRLKKSRETESLKNVPKLTSLGFKSKPKEIEGNGDGVQEDKCQLKTEGQSQTISTVDPITDATCNFLGIMELFGKFDPFLADHIARFGNQGSGYPSYLSYATMVETVSILGNELRENIVAPIKESKYYSIIVDSTPDVAHVDELTLVVRYIENGKPVERFIGFTPIKSHKSEPWTSDILETLKILKLDIGLCSGQ